ncbi:octaprenyl-diphosphate synthase [Pseudochelatococcus contaminans]|uniref:Octaprenyl-diphosphate synthase n=2 Tax=Pseudochelatococcus contaminans TaxID=1538103 RepID=A0A7W6EH63_9HYPH|nr:octaprenyl-diphosphate synthase [Pseudochelatococcus contaminans]
MPASQSMGPQGRVTEVDIVVMAAPCAKEQARAGGIDGLVSLVAGDMERVNSFILSRTGSDVTLIPEVASHLISSGGKRLRPMLTLAFAQLSGYEGDGGIRLAASVEFMHTATLLHDDVVDESDMRRGKLAARMLWGNEASVLVGDFLLGQAFKMMVEVGSLAALEVLANAAAVIAEGEVWQLSAAKDLSTTEEAYLGVVQAKTAALFAAAAEVGPIIAGLGERERKAARTYGDSLGIAFQLIDDALDYGGAAELLGKNVGDDFREGKITLPIVLALRNADADERAFWTRTLEQGEIVDGDLEKAIGILRSHNTLEATVQQARRYGDSAIAALDAFPDGAMKDALVDTVAFCIARAY